MELCFLINLEFFIYKSLMLRAFMIKNFKNRLTQIFITASIIQTIFLQVLYFSSDFWFMYLSFFLLVYLYILYMAVRKFKRKERDFLDSIYNFSFGINSLLLAFLQFYLYIWVFPVFILLNAIVTTYLLFRK